MSVPLLENNMPKVTVKKNGKKMVKRYPYTAKGKAAAKKARKNK